MRWLLAWIPTEEHGLTPEPQIARAPELSELAS